MRELLNIRDLTVKKENKTILKHLSLSFLAGKIYVIMGPNGAGKSTLAYELSKQKVGDSAPFLAFQEPPEISGITLEDLLLAILKNRLNSDFNLMDFYQKLDKNLGILGLDRSFVEKELNVEMSGGEKKKSEILQMMMLEPEVAILDEPDSGLDVDATKYVIDGVKSWHNSDRALIIITHNAQILKDLKIDEVLILKSGEIIRKGGEKLVAEILEHGFQETE